MTRTNETDLRALIQSEVYAAVHAALSEKGELRFLDTKEAAAYLSVSRQFLEIARHKGEGPPFTRLTRQIRYQREDLDAWMNKRRQDPEAD